VSSSSTYFTTSAVRDAANRDLILDRVEAQAGVRPQYLTGEDEARPIYLAWRSSAACSP
jgi:exopolyphosphatase/guanosine-5'-triphosphate,3'-diphosphate pyrophosphatase